MHLNVQHVKQNPNVSDVYCSDRVSLFSFFFVCVCVSDARTCSMANCQYGCEVMKGEVRCQCPSPGLQLAPDGRTCVGTAARCSLNKRCSEFKSTPLQTSTASRVFCLCHHLPLAPGVFLTLICSLLIKRWGLLLPSACGESMKYDEQSFEIQIAVNTYVDSLVALCSCAIPAALDNHTMSPFFFSSSALITV